MQKANDVAFLWGAVTGLVLMVAGLYMLYTKANAAGESREIVCYGAVPLRYTADKEGHLGPQPPLKYRLEGDTLFVDGGPKGHSITKLSPGTVCFFDASVQEEQREPERDTSKDRGA